MAKTPPAPKLPVNKVARTEANKKRRIAAQQLFEAGKAGTGMMRTPRGEARRVRRETMRQETSDLKAALAVAA